VAESTRRPRDGRALRCKDCGGSAILVCSKVFCVRCEDAAEEQKAAKKAERESRRQAKVEAAANRPTMCTAEGCANELGVGPSGRRRYKYCAECALPKYQTAASNYDISPAAARYLYNLPCGICGRPPGAGARSHSIDHCHETGVVRGVLCRDCNTGLGNFKDDIGNLQCAILYLTNGADFRGAGRA